MDLRIKKLTLKDFKGIRDLVIDFNGHNAAIYGSNECGKTTVEDSVLWLLTGKDSLGFADYKIKTIVDGEALHGLEHSVECIFITEEGEFTLKRAFKETYTKTTGEAFATLTGHTTDYWIDGVKCKTAGVYNDFVGNLMVSMDRLRSITDPLYVLEKIDWKVRRDKFQEVFGKISHEEVIKTDKRLLPLLDLIGKHSVDDFKAIQKAQKTEINKQLELIPIRMDEAERAKKDVDQSTLHQAQKDLDFASSLLTKYQSQLSELSVGGMAAKRKVDLSNLQAAKTELKTKYANDYASSTSDARKEKDAALSSVASLRTKANVLETEIEMLTKKIDTSTKYRADLILEYKALKAKEFTPATTDCPTCGQALPEEAIAATRERFNLEKSNNLAKINADGTKDKEKCAELTAQRDKLADELTAIEAEMSEKLNLSQEIVVPDAPDVLDDPEYKKICARIEEVEAAIASQTEDNSEERAELQNKITEAEKSIVASKEILRIPEMNKEQDARIAELQKSLEELGVEYEKISGYVFLCELFTTAKSKIYDPKITSAFKTIKVKMFETLQNGGLNDVCEITNLHGQPLNNAKRTQAGIEIINVFSNFYGDSAPIFVDNAESINVLPETDAQIIRLYVSEDKVLRIEIEK